MTKKVHKLQYLPDYNFTVLGITSDEKDYKLVWEINNTFGWDFERMDNLRFFNRISQVEHEFPLFSYYDENTHVLYRLIANKYEGFSLLDELKHLDYLFIIHDETGSTNTRSVSIKLKKINSIRAVFVIELSQIKNKERLLFS